MIHELTRRHGRPQSNILSEDGKWLVALDRESFTVFYNFRISIHLPVSHNSLPHLDHLLFHLDSPFLPWFTLVAVLVDVF